MLKEIWSGSWTSGSITISELPYYQMLLISESSGATMIPVYKNMTTSSNIQWGGVGMYPYKSEAGDNAFHFYGFSATQPSPTSTTLTMVKAHSWSIYYHATPYAGNNATSTIDRIYGIL